MRARFTAVAPITLLLTSCVSAGRLNREVAASEASGDLVVPADPCPGSSAAGYQVSSPPSIGTFAPTSGAGAQNDLQRGIRLIQAAASDPRAYGDADARAFGARLGAATGMDLGQFSDAMASVDEAGADDADAALASPGVTAVAEFSGASEASRDYRPGGVAGTPGTVRLDRSEWEKTARLIARTTAENGWTASFTRSLGRAAADGSRSFGSFDDLRKRYLVASYMAAYFRNGQIFALQFDQAGIRQRLLDKLKLTIKDENALRAAQGEIDRLAADYEKALCSKGSVAGGKCVLLGVIGERTFVTRAGKSYGFPGVTGTFDPTADKKISTNRIATDEVVGDLVRVVLEGVGDQRFRVPGTANSTMCSFDSSLCGSEAQAAVLARVNDAGDRAEAATTSIVGMAIRGGWLFSLNNEALARSITVGVAVGARKAAEAATWKKLSVCPGNTGAFVPAFSRLRVVAVE